MKIIFLGHSF